MTVLVQQWFLQASPAERDAYRLGRLEVYASDCGDRALDAIATGDADSAVRNTRYAFAWARDVMSQLESLGVQV